MTLAIIQRMVFKAIRPNRPNLIYFSKVKIAIYYTLIALNQAFGSLIIVSGTLSILILYTFQHI